MTVSCPIDYNYFGSFANIGTNGSIQPGKREIEGTADLVGRVQQVINTAHQATNLVNSVSGLGRQLGNLFRVIDMKLLPETEGYAVVAGSIQQLSEDLYKEYQLSGYSILLEDIVKAYIKETKAYAG